MTENFRSPAEYTADSGILADVERLTASMFQQACRVDWKAAGFSLLSLGEHWGSKPLRQLMLEIMDHLSPLCQSHWGRGLHPLSMSRFNQQATTKPHRDGGPEESLLLLGYEPTPIESRLSLLDYSFAAHQMGLFPLEFLERHNPMFTQGAELLLDYTTEVREFDAGQFQIVLINNSSAAYDAQNSRWQGVLHQATIPQPREDAFRVVNSIQLALHSGEEDIPVSRKERTQFLSDDALGRQYGKMLS